jgi:hypothetical protein
VGLGIGLIAGILLGEYLMERNRTYHIRREIDRIIDHAEYRLRRLK